MTVSELPPLRLGFSGFPDVMKKKQPQDLLRELPWLQMRFSESG